MADRSELLRRQIVVTGDVMINWLAQPLEPLNGEKLSLAPGWRRRNCFVLHRLAGGACYLAELIGRAGPSAASGSDRGQPFEIVRPDAASVVAQSMSTAVNGILRLMKVPKRRRSGKEGHVWRIERAEGFWGPAEPNLNPVPLAPEPVSEQIACVVVNDAGFGFRDQAANELGPLLDRLPADAWIVLRIAPPIRRSAVFQLLASRVAQRRPPGWRVLTILDAEDLRGYEVDLSRRLSWDLTAQDIARLVSEGTGPLGAVKRLGDLVVRFDLDGAAHVDPEGAIRLFVDPKNVENGFRRRMEGEMHGGTAALAAELVRAIVGILPSGGDGDQRRPDDPIAAGIRTGIVASRSLVDLGFVEPASEVADVEAAASHRPAPALRFPVALEVAPDNVDEIVCYPVMAGAATQIPWSLLRSVHAPDRLPEELLELARRIVRRGPAIALRDLPTASFGDLVLADRSEIENYRAIANLIDNYVARPGDVRPLSIAVFGPPGAGKSFGVTQIAKAAVRGKVHRQVFNLAQFRLADDLIGAFHVVRDIAISDDIPLIFFDEFDCKFDGYPLGWLRYFLAPMQDGDFKDGDRIHKIGKAIFVFAGGTHRSFKQFAREAPVETGPLVPGDGPPAPGATIDERGAADPTHGVEPTTGPPHTEADAGYRDAKGPDFVSRLRGVVDVLGPNPMHARDDLFIVRRALLLRSLIVANAPHLVDRESAELSIDPSVLDTLLQAGLEAQRYGQGYKHGARSLEAVLHMSSLHKRRVFEQSALPSDSQLAMHVDQRLFTDLLRTCGKAVRDRQADPVDINSVQRCGGAALG